METLLRQREAATVLRLSERTLERLRVQGVGPKFVRCGRRSIRYREADLNEWSQTYRQINGATCCRQAETFRRSKG
jgi:predicted DNA-binding transcriptional regulator AlpA